MKKLITLQEAKNLIPLKMRNPISSELNKPYSVNDGICKSFDEMAHWSRFYDRVLFKGWYLKFIETLEGVGVDRLMLTDEEIDQFNKIATSALECVSYDHLQNHFRNIMMFWDAYQTRYHNT